MGRHEDRLAIFQRQSHAFHHVALGDVPDDVAMCPLCLEPFGELDLRGQSGQEPHVTLDHAPPELDTRLGLSRGACLTHRACNTERGDEARAGRYQHEVRKLAAGDLARFRATVNGEDSVVHVRRHPTGLILGAPMSPGRNHVSIPLELPRAAQLAELKAAYLIAFTALGYSWIACRELDAYRAAIRGDAGAEELPAPLIRVSEADQELANSILVHETGLVVIGDSAEFGVLLPNHSRIDVRQGTINLRDAYAVPWLPDRWWRSPTEPAFDWDCRYPRPRWRLDAA